MNEVEKGTVASWFQGVTVCLLIVASVYFAIVTAQQNNRLEREAASRAQDTAQILKQVSRDGSCATNRMIGSLILQSDHRAHHLHTGAYLSGQQRHAIRHAMKSACQ